MRINIITFGKIKDKNLVELIDYYKKLCSKYAKVKIVNLKDQNSKITVEQVEVLQNKYKNLVVLSEHGKQYSTEEFAKHLKAQELQNGEISFLIGGAYGYEKSALERVRSLSLGQMTFPHEMTVMLLLEQLFRVMNLNRGGKYHK